MFSFLRRFFCRQTIPPVSVSWHGLEDAKSYLLKWNYTDEGGLTIIVTPQTEDV